jgi:chromosome partitioning protein
MTTTIIAFVSQKGGVGKSTLSRALAREAAVGGLTVKIADLDTQQGTSADWNRIRLNARIEPVLAVEAFATATQALRVADHYNLLIIDGPARTSSGTLGR